MRLYQDRDHKWAKIIYNKYLKGDDPLSIFRVINPPEGFETWNFMIICRELICKHLTWDIGRGEEALFWEDSWDGKPPLIQSNISANLIENLINLWGNKV